MNTKLKLGAYAVLIILTAWFGSRFYADYSGGSAHGTTVATTINHPTPKTNQAPVQVAGTNATAGDTNNAAGDTNNIANTNATEQTTNTVAQATTPDTNATATTAAADQDPTTMAQTVSGRHEGKTIIYLALFVAAVVGLGLLVAIDITHLIGAKAGDYLFQNVGDAQRDPEYEKAEQVWANGKHLEAIQMLRDYYKRNPRQIHAALRIAEIYEKDLHNHLAAALEYEEVLKHKLPGDRWAWAAIHLCNLYSKIGQQEKTMGLLRRIADEHPNTAAAKKARQRLGLPEPDEIAVETPVEAANEAGDEETFDVSEEKGEWPAEAEGENPPTAPSTDPKSNLPPGFRPKK